MPRSEDVTSPGEPASPDLALVITRTPSAPPYEAEDQSVEKDKTVQQQPSVYSIYVSPSRRTLSKVTAPEFSTSL